MSLARTALGLALGAVTAVAAFAAGPRVGLWPLVFVAFVPMIVAEHHVLPRRLSGLALGIGLGGSILLGIWGVLPPHSAPVVRAIPVIVAVFVTAIGSLDRPLMDASHYRGFLVTVPIAWTGLSFFTSRGPLGTIGSLQ